VSCTEAARLQEDTAGAHLPNLLYDTSQLRGSVGHLSHVLYRVQGSAVGSRTSGTSMYRVWTDDPREVQRSSQRRLHTTLVSIACHFRPNVSMLSLYNSSRNFNPNPNFTNPKTRSIWKMLGPFATASRHTPMSTTTTTTTPTTTTRDRGDLYGPIEWAQ